MVRGLFLFLVFSSFLSFGQSGPYHPAANKTGTIAVSMNSNLISSWGDSVVISRGWQDIADTTIGKVSHGNEIDALGMADNLPVSLGDGGVATYFLTTPISNGQGYDFAIFENSFDHYYLELAFVEVSSDGSTFVRFPVHSLTDTLQQVGGFGLLDPTEINNLAGKYKGGYGTPFDLEELKESPGLNVNAITHIRIIDVVGSLIPLYGSRDTAGNWINDPYPTAFPSGGFDLDAIAFLLPNSLTTQEESRLKPFEVISGSKEWKIGFKEGYGRITVMDLSGRIIQQTKNVSDYSFSPNEPGTYIFYIELNHLQFIEKGKF